MKSLIILTWVAIAHATCGYEHGIWKPRDGQDFSLVMKELAINRKDIEKLNPDMDIDDYPRITYNVPFKVPQYSGQWTNGCPPLLIIRDTTDGLMTYSGLPSIWNAGNPHQTSTRTIQVAVDTKTRTITVYATKPSFQAGTELSEHSTSADPLSISGTEEDVNSLRSHTKPVEESVQTNDGWIDTAHESEPSSEAALVDPSYSPSFHGQEKSSTNNRNNGEPAAPAPTTPKDTFRFAQTTCNHSADIPPSTQQDDEQSERLSTTTTGGESVESSMTRGASSTIDEAAPTSCLQINGKESTGTVTTNPIMSYTSLDTVEPEIPTSRNALSDNADSSKKPQSNVQPTTIQETTYACENTPEAEDSKGYSVTTTQPKPADNAGKKTGSGKSKTQDDETSNLSHKTTKVETAATETDIPANEPATSLAETGTTLTTLPSKAIPETSVTSALVSKTTLPRAICAKRAYEGYYLVFDTLVRTTSRAWCQEYAAGRAMQAGDERVSSTETDPIDREASYSISWVEDCIGHAQSMESPLGSYGPLCSEIFYDAVWRSCECPFVIAPDNELTETQVEKQITGLEASPATPSYLSAPKWAFGPTSHCPKNLKDTTASWTKNNPSTYLLDSGLWSACRLSRKIIGDKLDEAKFFVVRTRTNHHDLSDTELDTSRACASQHRNIVVSLSQDLFILQLDDSDVFILYFNDRGIPHETAGGSPRLQHVGWQYNPAWATSVRESSWTPSLDSLCCYIVYGAKSGGLETFWLINYRIKRKHWVPLKEELSEPEPQIFEADGFRLTEVPANENGPWDEVVDDCDPHTLVDFIAFVNQLQELINYTLRSIPIQVGKQKVSIKILACESR
ncbi:hypothetical protein V3481_019451 [Fusarium oxysporum f. sp. vasinfectum]